MAKFQNRTERIFSQMAIGALLVAGAFILIEVIQFFTTILKLIR